MRVDLLKPLFAQFATLYGNRASSFIAEGDTVVVECRGDVGQMNEFTEYMDTALCERVLTVVEAPSR